MARRVNKYRNILPSDRTVVSFSMPLAEYLIVLEVQVLFVCVVFEAYALDHHQPNQVGYTGAGFAGYATPSAPYGRYNVYDSPPQPYSFGYDNVDEYGNRQFRIEKGDSNNAKTGSYGYRDVNGLYRRVNYVADANGFRVTVDTNEPGTAPGASADAVFNAAPVVPPVPSGAAQTGAPTAFAARAAAPYNARGYRGYGRYGYNPYAAVAGADNAPYGRQGLVTSSPALGGYAYGGSVPYDYGTAGYAVGYAPGVYGAPATYGGWPSAHHGYRRR
nr:shematrin-like protein 3 [Dermacentor andersoni]